MLLQFSVSNFLSFREETVFSMLATGDKCHPSHLIGASAGKHEPAVRCAAIYGANGSGKSNLIKAIRFAQRLILEGTRPGRPIPVLPHKLADPAKPLPSSKFQFIFRHDGAVYDYGFVVDSKHVVEEWLFGTSDRKGAQERLIFTRTYVSHSVVDVEPGPLLLGDRSSHSRQRVKFIAEGTRNNQLFLTEAAEKNLPSISPVFEWFERVLLVISAGDRCSNLPGLFLADEALTQFAAKFLRNSDTGICSIGAKIHHEEFAIAATREEDHEGNVISEWHRTDDEQPVIRIDLTHAGQGSTTADFRLEEESEGTQRLYELLPMLYVLSNKESRVVFIDELERRLHSSLTRSIVEAVQTYMSRTHSQFVFTTHDTNLLDLDLFRRDEIWFVEKDREGATHLTSLAEFKIRPDIQVERGYLHGRFGGIPYVGNLSRLGLGEHGASEAPALQAV